MNTLFVGQEIIHLDSVDSTNNYTSGLARQSVIHEGLVVYADLQTEGKGQRHNRWSSESKANLLCSIFLTPHFLSASEQFLLTQAISLALVNVVESLSHSFTYIKWPNDILVGDQKIAGILVENTLRGSYLGKSIVGIGLNVNQVLFEPEHKATSLKLLNGKHFPIDHVLKLLCENVEKQYLQLKQTNGLMLKEYSKRLYKHNQWTPFLINQKESQLMRILGVEKSGKLKLENKRGEINSFDFHQAKLIR